MSRVRDGSYQTASPNELEVQILLEVDNFWNVQRGVVEQQQQ